MSQGNGRSSCDLLEKVHVSEQVGMRRVPCKHRDVRRHHRRARRRQQARLSGKKGIQQQVGVDTRSVPVSVLISPPSFDVSNVFPEGMEIIPMFSSIC